MSDLRVATPEDEARLLPTLILGDRLRDAHNLGLTPTWFVTSDGDEIWGGVMLDRPAQVQFDFIVVQLPDQGIFEIVPTSEWYPVQEA